jgi:methionyl-tRNA formyltransferase
MRKFLNLEKYQKLMFLQNEYGRIQWSNLSVDILRLINASNKPYAGAFCQYEGKKVLIWHAELVDDYKEHYAVPGQVTKIGDDFVDVVCAGGELRLLELEIDESVMAPNIIIKSIRKRLT